MPTPAIFYVSDILHIFFEYLAPYDAIYYWNRYPDFYRPQGRSYFRNVARFGLTCSYVYDYALDYLWHHLHDLKQLLRILPMFKVEESINGLGKPVVRGYLESPIEAEHWERLKFYARRVKMAYLGRDGIELPVFDELFRWSQGQGILPNVEQMDWEEESFVHKEPLLFLTPSMTHFALQRRLSRVMPYLVDSRAQSEADELLVIQSIIERMPNLRCLYLEQIVLTAAAIKLTTHLDRLDTITYVQLNWTPESDSQLDSLDDLLSFSHLALPTRTEERPHFAMDSALFSSFVTWPQLRYLALNVDALDCSQLAGPFETIRRLRLSGNASAKMEFMKHIQAPNLRMVQLANEDPDILAEDWTDIKPCLEIIGLRFSNTVDTVHYDRHMHQHLGPQRVSVMYLIEPLFSISNLRELQIRVGDDICLTDDEVCHLFQGCPRLHILQIDFIAGVMQPTPRCIQHAVEYAPQLVKWRFTLDFSRTAVETLRALDVKHPSIVNLQFIMAGLPMDPDFEAIAMEIFRIFPLLQPQLVVNDGYNNLWGKVLRQVSQLQGRTNVFWKD